MKRVKRMKGIIILFALVVALAGCGGSSGGGGGGMDTMTITLDGVTTVYTESGTDPEITADGEVAGSSVVALFAAGNTFDFTIIFPGITTGTYTVTAAPPGAVATLRDTNAGLNATGVSGTVTITAYGEVGGAIVGEISGLSLVDLFTMSVHPATVSFSVVRDT